MLLAVRLDSRIHFNFVTQSTIKTKGSNANLMGNLMRYTFLDTINSYQTKFHC